MMQTAEKQKHQEELEYKLEEYPGRIDKKVFVKNNAFILRSDEC